MSKEEDGMISPEQREWLEANHQHLLAAQIPALVILDSLVASGIFDTRMDDYQIICSKETPREQTRALVGALNGKSKAAFTAFISALERYCLHVLKECHDPPDVFRQFDSDVCAHFRSLDEEETLAFSWLERTSSGIKITDYLRHLAIIDKRKHDTTVAEKLASSASELDRQQAIHSQLNKVEVIELESIFDEEIQCSNDVGCSVPRISETHGATSQSEDGPTGATSGKEGSEVRVWNQSRRQVGIYGAAGCGKTASLVKLASLYAQGKLWQNRFRAFCLCRLRNPDVAGAKNFAQLLEALPFSPSVELCKKFADAASACRGRGLLVALDGIDELDASHGKETFVWRLLAGSVLREACVVATSRPCTVARNFFRAYDTNLELLGFREEQVAEFVQQRLGHTPELISKLDQVLARNASLVTLMSVPLLAFMMCDVFAACSNSPPTTRSQLYSKLLCLIVQRAVAEGRVRLPDNDPDEEDSLQDACHVKQLDGTAKKLLLEVAKVAWQAIKEGLATFGHSLVRDAGCSREALELGLLVCYRRVIDQHVVPVRRYAFHHVTVQEFLAAFCLVDQVIDKETLRKKLCKLEMGPHQYVVVQFLAGLLPAHLLPSFFAFLNTFLHQGWDWKSEECRDRLRLCLQCVREAYSDGKTFPQSLQLPPKVSLFHVTAADVELLSSAMDNCRSSVKEMVLFFDRVAGEAAMKRFRQVEALTKKAWESLMAALAECTSLEVLYVSGPEFVELFTPESWCHLLRAVCNTPLQTLCLSACSLDDKLVSHLAIELEHNTTLTRLELWGQHDWRLGSAPIGRQSRVQRDAEVAAPAMEQA